MVLQPSSHFNGTKVLRGRRRVKKSRDGCRGRCRLSRNPMLIRLSFPVGHATVYGLPPPPKARGGRGMRTLAAVVSSALAAGVALAQTPFPGPMRRRPPRHEPELPGALRVDDAGGGDGVLRRVHGFVEASTPLGLPSIRPRRQGRGPEDSEGRDRAHAGRVPPDSYEWGVTYSGMLRAARRPATALCAVRGVALAAVGRLGAAREAERQPPTRASRLHPPGAEAGRAGRLGRHVGRDDQGHARGRREGPAALDRQLSRLDLEQGVPPGDGTLARNGRSRTRSGWTTST